MDGLSNVRLSASSVGAIGLTSNQSGFPRSSSVMDSAAKALGMSSSDLKTAMQGGQSLEAIAKSKGISLDTVIAAMSASIQKANPSVSADQATKIATAMATRTPPAGASRPGGPQPDDSVDQVQGTSAATSTGGHHRRQAVSAALDSVAQLLGTTASDLATSTQSGQSLASIASSKGVSQTDLVDAIKTALQGSDSSLSATQATEFATAMATGIPPGNRAEAWAAGTSASASTFSIGA
ncbi:MAG TPA: hypothetical protein VF337_12645 [Candidatus Limnocylindrales bacterium]